MAHTGKRERSGTATKAPAANRGGRYGLLLLLLIGTYLLAAFSGAKLATEVQVLLFAFVLLIALRNSPLPAPWPLVIGAATVIGTAVTFLASLSGSPNGKAAEDLWKALILLMAVIMVVRRVLAKRTVTIQSIYGALSAYIIIGLMFASSFAAINYLSTSDFFADNEPANTQTFQYFSFTTLTTLGYGDFTAAESGSRSIAVLEALTGQIFLATLVARLVAAYRTPDQPEQPEPPGRPGSADGGPADDDERRE
ncbi:MAG: potassium channel family protein [Trebonia sp.]|uniref:potassium channel family protein n=1 Tax=Trebonia sp. TaxID=2767075 RepID=UPI003BAE88AC